MRLADTDALALPLALLEAVTDVLGVVLADTDDEGLADGTDSAPSAALQLPLLALLASTELTKTQDADASEPADAGIPEAAPAAAGNVT